MTQSPRILQSEVGPGAPWWRIATRPRARRGILAAVVLAFLVSRLWLLTGFRAAGGDLGIYEAYARMGVDEGQVAYRDFAIEYPPLAWWFIADSRRIARAIQVTLQPFKDRVLGYVDYAYLLRVELLAVDFLCLMLLLLVGAKISSEAEWGLPAAYCLASASQPYLIYNRLDLILLAFFLASIYCWLRSLAADGATDRWAMASYFCLGLGASFKIIPILFAPFLILADLRALGSRGRIARRVAALAAGALGPFAIQACVSGPAVLDLFQYHSQREIHIESVWGSLMLAARSLGFPCEPTMSHSSCALIGPLGSPLKTLAIVSAVASGSALGAWAISLGARFDRGRALDFAHVATVNAVALSIVFSPQYLNWLLPLVLIVAFRILPNRAAGWCFLLAALAAIVAISGWLYPHHYGSEDGLAKLAQLPVALSLARSALLAGVAVLLSLCLVREGVREVRRQEALSRLPLGPASRTH